MTWTAPHSQEKQKAILARIANGEKINKVAVDEGVDYSTIRRWIKREGNVSNPTCTQYVQPSRILIYDIETLPNLGYFWDTISDRSIPLDFIVKPKSICTIAYKWLGEPETYVLVIDTPYNDKAVLEAFLPEWSKANYVVAHYSRFDKPFIAARLMANGLPSLPPVNDICTYKLAKHHFGRSLNGNKLDHLGSILGVGNKIKTSADLWVGCASGDKESLAKMAEYNVQDVELLAKVFNAMLPYVKSKLNYNLLTDDPLQKCKQCGSSHIEHKGFEYVANTMRHRYQCRDCGSWSTYQRKKS
jgi:DNA polymerase III epsilon subunit-like protein